MKSVSGSVVSSYPVSVKRAARTLSRFASTETGASDAVSAYLRRASAAFNELVHLHKEMGALTKSRCKRALEPLSETVGNGNLTDAEKKENPSGEESNAFRGRILDFEDGDLGDNSRKKGKTYFGEVDNDEVGERVTKKRKKGELENGKSDNNHQHRKKRRKDKGGD